MSPSAPSQLPRPIPWLATEGETAPQDDGGIVGLKGACSSTDQERKVPQVKVYAPRRLLGMLRPKAPLALLPKAKARPASPAPSAGGSAKKEKRQRFKPRALIRNLVWARRICQGGFLLLFVYLLTQTTFRGDFSSEQTVRLPYAVEGFLLTDPYVALMTLLSTHSVYRGLAWSLLIVALTLLVGRAFCGWICPFGTLHHITSWLFPSRYIRAKRRVASNRTQWWQVGKYYALWGSLGAALFGSAVGGWLDPICIGVRAIGLGAMPLFQYFGFRAAQTAQQTNIAAVQSASDGMQDFLAQNVFTPEQEYYHQTWFVLFSLIAVLFMNRVVPRFWCRALCPLGALLGHIAKFSLFGMEKDHSKCTDCNLCLIHCQGADSPEGGVKHQKDECHLCFNCEAACPEDVIRFKFFPNIKSRTTLQLQRRTALASVTGAALAIPGMRISNWPDRAYSAKVIRPPGAVPEREFLERCIRCAECMKVCPNNALHPTFFEAGLEGLWTPTLVARIGYCEYSCVLCGDVCPTGAIQKISPEHKMGSSRPPIRIGTAMFDRGRCLPWSMATPCIVCEEFCPTSPKAIWVESVEVPKRSKVSGPNGEHPAMETVAVQRPHVDPSLCIGCGACENVCPIVDQPAVYVTNAGESRSRTNVILLEDTNYNAG